MIKWNEITAKKNTFVEKLIIYSELDAAVHNVYGEILTAKLQNSNKIKRICFKISSP